MNLSSIQVIYLQSIFDSDLIQEALVELTSKIQEEFLESLFSHLDLKVSLGSLMKFQHQMATDQSTTNKLTLLKTTCQT